MKDRLLKAIAVVCLTLLGSALIAREVPSPGHAQVLGGRSTVSMQAAPLAPVGNGFNFQGKLNENGSPADGLYDFTFKLYDAETGGGQVGSTVSRTGITVTAGLFAVQLDFGAAAFRGDARWLEIAVQEAGGSGYTTLAPRQGLMASPYAMSLVPGAVVNGTLGSGVAMLSGINSGSTGVGLYGSGYYGVRGASSYVGMYGTGSNTGVWGTGGSYGLYGDSTAGTGAYGLSSANFGAGVWGVATGAGGYGVRADGAGYGVYSFSSGGTALYGSSSTGTGVSASTGTGIGISGYSSTNIGIRGQSGDNYGVAAYSSGSTAVYGYGTDGVRGEGNGYNGNGVIGYASNGPVAYSIWGLNSPGYAGYFNGRVHVNGTLSKGAGSFKIDHPLDPENKYLYHSFVESPDMKNIYDGVVTLDAKGEAVIEMEEWFDAINRDFRYQFAPIGAPMPNLYVAEEMNGNRFKIAGGKPGMKVSWQVTGTRKDPYAERNRIPVEERKSAEERGTYLHPELYGQPESKGKDYERIERLGLPQPPAQPAKP